MGRKKKIEIVQTTKILDENDQVVEVSEIGVPGLFTVHSWDIEEELQNNEALRQYQQEKESDIW